MVQRVVTRTAGNSAQIKTWAAQFRYDMAD